MNLPNLVGIAGKAGSGKDTLADHLAQHYNYTKYAIATPIKRLLNERFGWTDEMWENREWKNMPNPAYGHATDHPPFSPRSWAQWLGTEVGRFLNEDIWVDLMEHEWEHLKATKGDQARLVISDVRYPNEAIRIRKLGGVIIHLNRQLTDVIPNHSSENEIPGWLIDFYINNNDTVKTLFDRAMYFLKHSSKISRTA